MDAKDYLGKTVTFRFGTGKMEETGEVVGLIQSGEDGLETLEALGVYTGKGTVCQRYVARHKQLRLVVKIPQPYHGRRERKPRIRAVPFKEGRFLLAKASAGV